MGFLSCDPSPLGSLTVPPGLAGPVEGGGSSGEVVPCPQVSWAHTGGKEAEREGVKEKTEVEGC